MQYQFPLTNMHAAKKRYEEFHSAMQSPIKTDYPEIILKTLSKELQRLKDEYEISLFVLLDEQTEEICWKNKKLLPRRMFDLFYAIVDDSLTGDVKPQYKGITNTMIAIRDLNMRWGKISYFWQSKAHLKNYVIMFYDL